MARVKVRRHGHARPGLSVMMKRKLPVVLAFRAESAASLAAAVEEDVCARCRGEHAIRHAHRRVSRGRSGHAHEIALICRVRESVRLDVDRRAGGQRRIRLRNTHRDEGGADAVVHGVQRELRAVRPHRPRVRRTGRDVREVAAEHAPGAAVELELDVAAQHEERGVAGTVYVARHRGARSSGEHHELVDVPGVRRAAVARQPLGRVAQRLGPEVAEPHGRLAAARDQPGLLEHLEVPRDGGLGHLRTARRARRRSASPSLSRARIARRVGSASAPKTASSCLSAITRSFYNEFVMVCQVTRARPP